MTKNRKRVLSRQRRLDTTLSAVTMERMRSIASAVESSGSRRYSVSYGEVADLAIEWMEMERMSGRPMAQAQKDNRRDFRIGLILKEGSLARLKKLSLELQNQPGYTKPFRGKERSLGDTLDWCVEHYFNQWSGRSSKKGK